MMQIKVSTNAKLFLFFLIVIFALKASTLDDPFYWDDLSIGLAIKEIEASPFPLKVVTEDTFLFHPTLLPYILAMISKIFGYNLFFFHAAIFFSGAIVLTFFYLICEHILKSKFYSLLSTSLLLSLPMYFSFLGRIYYDIPLLAFNIMGLYYLLKEDYWKFLVVSAAGALIKETYVLILPAAFLWIILNKKKEKLSLLAVPFLIVITWFFLSSRIAYYPKIVSAYFPYSSMQLSEYFGSYVNYLIESFIANGMFIITLPAAAYILSALRPKKDKNEMVLLVYIFSYVFFFFFMVHLQRYMLQVFPAMVIFLLLAICKVFSGFKYKDHWAAFTIGCLILILVANYYSADKSFCGCDLEDNMDYTSSLSTYVAAGNYLDQNYPNSSVLTMWPFTKMLENPFLGFVSKKHIVTYFGDDYNETELIITSTQINVRLAEDFSNYIVDQESRGKITLVQTFHERDSATYIYRKVMPD